MKRMMRAAALGSAALLGAVAVSATDFTWIAIDSGINWTTSANWSFEGFPANGYPYTSNDIAFFTTDGVGSISVNTAANFTLESMQVRRTMSFNATTAREITVGALRIEGGGSGVTVTTTANALIQT